MTDLGIGQGRFPDEEFNHRTLQLEGRSLMSHFNRKDELKHSLDCLLFMEELFEEAQTMLRDPITKSEVMPWMELVVSLQRHVLSELNQLRTLKKQLQHELHMLAEFTEGAWP